MIWIFHIQLCRDFSEIDIVQVLYQGFGFRFLLYMTMLDVKQRVFKGYYLLVLKGIKVQILN